MVAIRSDNGILNFYPRPPRGGRPDRGCSAHGRRAISIHALREEGDPQKICEPPLLLGLISIHALREEGDLDDLIL